jgi:hypothetical protein
VPKKILLPALLAALLTLGAFATAAGAESGGSTEVTKAKPPTGVFKARIGWFYTDTSDFPQSKVGPAVFHWGACAKAGGVQMAFPLKSHIYQGVNGAELSTTKKTIALLSGPPLNPSDPFKAEIYVGDLAKPGKTTLKVECIGRSHGNSGPLVTKMTGGLKTEYVRKDINFKPANSLTALNLLDVFGTEPVTQNVIVRSCSEPGTPSITLSSPALAAGPKGGSYVTIPANDEAGTFEGLETPSKEAGPGEYKAIVSCGSGRVGVGVIGLH